jgi:hypothetical protein
MNDSQRNPLLSVLRWSVFVFLLLLLTYVGITAWAALDTNPDHHAVQAILLVSNSSLAKNAWDFARPLLQLMVVLVIVDWVLHRLGVRLDSGVRHFEWNVQAIIAIIVVAAYAVAELGGIGNGGLKDIALVVVGFYFGTQRRSSETDVQGGKTRLVEEHINPTAEILVTAKSGSPSPEVRSEGPSDSPSQDDSSAR